MTNETMTNDQAERQQALDPQTSFIVQAPAGSGKTELIIQRLLTLLAYVKRPEEILAITFTKKAAHEMRARVLNALEHASHQPEPEKPHERLTWRLATKVLARDRELKWNLMSNPNQLQIKTIDSFCTFLTGQLPLLSHFGSQPDIANYAQTLYRETVHEVLSHIEENHPWSPAVARLLTHTDNDMSRLTKLLINLLQKRDQWQRYLSLDLSDDDKRRLLTRHIADVVQFNLQNAAERFPAELTDELLSLLRYANQLDATTLPDDDLPAWQTLANFLLTKDGTWRKKVDDKIGFGTLKNLKGEEEKINRAMRARHKALVEALLEDEALRAALDNIRDLPEPCYTEMQWDTLKALLEVLKITLAQLRVTFQSYGQIDFIENAWGASQALGDTSNPTDLALSLDYQIQHILVDEFQDTSFSQYHLLEMLTHGWQHDDGRTLFVVGDPMQSIYRFRQAEVGLFIRMQQDGIGMIQLTPLTLTVNFRSESSIVNWNNQQFSAIFPDYSDIGTGAVHFSPSIANQENEPTQPSITINGFLNAPDTTQADAVVTYIQSILADHPTDKIAILVRTRSHLSAIVPALKAAKLRYQAVKIDPLITRQSIQDLLALTRALLHPADRIAWLAILRAPWCGLTLSDLLNLSGQDRYSILWDRMNNKDVQLTLSPSGQKRLATILPALQAAMHHRQRGGFRQWIEQTWLALGGPATLADHEEMADVNEYFELLEELASRSHHINLELLNERIKQLNASNTDESAPIQIMTIHSAKGLEFDTVILPRLDAHTKNDDRSLLLWMEHPLHDEKISLLLAPMHAADSEAESLYRYIEKLQKDKARFEVDRLLYVATTRAKKRLHLVFNLKDEDKFSECGSFLDKLWPLIKHKTQLIQPDASASVDNHVGEESGRAINRFVETWQHPVSLIQPTEVGKQQSVNGFLLRDQAARLIGTITHLVFQQISQHGTDWWQQQSSTAQEHYLVRLLQQAGLSPDQHASAASTIQQMMTRALQDERGQWILKSHKEAQSEFRLSAVINDQCEQLIIDRTFIDEAGTRWIIDYKTAEDQHDNLTEFLKKQTEKYRVQLQKYSAAMQRLENRPIKTGLYFPAIPAWCEETTDDADPYVA